jgi:hypothetical protein
MSLQETGSGVLQSRSIFFLNFIHGIWMGELRGVCVLYNVHECQKKTNRKTLSTFPLYLSRTSPGLVRSRLLLITNNNTVVGIARGPPTQLHP